MDKKHFFKHKLRNLLHTVIIIGAMSALLAFSSQLLFGGETGLWVLLSTATVMFVLPDLSSQWVLRLYGAQQIHPAEAGQLYALVEELSRRANLPRAPKLFWVPSHIVNAFAVGNSRDSAIAISEGLLRMLSQRELAGALAHELSHISKNDLKLIALADLMSRLTHFMALMGMFLVFMTLPLMFIGQASISLLGLLLLMAAPTISALLQFALSRVREFDADLEAVRLTGDPEGLAMALHKIEQQQGSRWRRIFLPGYRNPEPSVFRTHPDTQERIRRLLALKPPQIRQPLQWHDQLLQDQLGHGTRHPRHRFFYGIWR